CHGVVSRCSAVPRTGARSAVQRTHAALGRAAPPCARGARWLICWVDVKPALEDERGPDRPTRKSARALGREATTCNGLRRNGTESDSRGFLVQEKQYVARLSSGYALRWPEPF